MFKSDRDIPPISPTDGEDIQLESSATSIEPTRKSKKAPAASRHRSQVLDEDQPLLRQMCGSSRKERDQAAAHLLERHPDWTRNYLLRITTKLGLRKPVPRAAYTRPTDEDKSLLRAEGAKGGPSLRAAQRIVLERHPDWNERKVQNLSRQVSATRPPKRWTKKQTQDLVDMAGTCQVKVIAELLGRTSGAIQMKLKREFGVFRARVVEGYSRRDISRILCCSYRRVNQMLEEGSLAWIGSKILRSSRTEFVERHTKTLSLELTAKMISRLLRSREPQEQQKFAAILGVPIATVRKWVNQGILRIRSPRIHAESFRQYCRENYPALNWDLLTREQRQEIDYLGDGWRTSIQKIQGKLEACERGARFTPLNLEVLFSVDLGTAQDIFIRIATMAGSNKGGAASRKIREGKTPDPLSKQDIVGFLAKEAKQFADVCARSPRRRLRELPQYKHVMRTYQCPKCDRRIRGNAVYRHIQSCGVRRKTTSAAMVLGRGRIRFTSLNVQRPLNESSSAFQSARAG